MARFLPARLRLLHVLSLSLCSSPLANLTPHSRPDLDIATSRKPSVPDGAGLSFPVLAPPLPLRPGEHGRGGGRSPALLAAHPRGSLGPITYCMCAWAVVNLTPYLRRGVEDAQLASQGAMRPEFL